jgi:hypothetical protein
MNKRENIFKPLSAKLTFSNRFIKNALSLRARKFDEFIGQRRQYIEEIDSFNHHEDDNKENTDSSNSTGTAKNQEKLNLKELTYKTYHIEDLDYYCEMVKSDNLAKFSEGVIALRRLLASPVKPPIKEVVKNGTIKLLITKVRNASSLIRPDIVWIFTNVASSSDLEPTEFLLENGILDVIESLLKENISVKIVDQIVWLIANLSGDGDASILRAEQLLNALMTYFFNEGLTTTIKINILWAFSNILKEIDNGEFDPATLKETTWLSQLTHVCLFAIKNSKTTFEAKAIHYSILILQKLSNVFTKNIFNLLVNYDALIPLLQLMTFDKIEDPEILSALRLLGNFTALDDECTRGLVDNNFLAIIYNVLAETSNNHIKKEIFWALSNIVCDLEEHARIVLSVPGFFEKLFDELNNNTMHTVRKEIIWCLMNFTTLQDIEVVYRLYDKDILTIVENYLIDSDYRILGVCIEGLDNILSTLVYDGDGKSKKIFNEIRESQCIAIIEEKLLQTNNKVIYKKAYKLLNDHFHKNDDGLSLRDSDAMDDQDDYI